MIDSRYVPHRPKVIDQGYVTPSRLRYRLERIWLRRRLRKLILTSSILCFLAINTIASFFLFGEKLQISKIMVEIREFVLNRPELSIQDLNIKNADPDLSNQIRAILQISFPINPLKVNIQHLQDLITEIESVDYARIRITEKGILEIYVKERTPVVVHRLESELMLLDVLGRRVGDIFNRSDRADLPLVAGQGANLQVREALEIYKASQDIINRVRGLVMIGERRWDLILSADQTIKLPEAQPNLKLLSFLASPISNDILTGDFPVIDLRHHEHIILRKRKDLYSRNGFVTE